MSKDMTKQIWKYQEGLAVLALEKIFNEHNKVHWHHTPEGMSIDPDIIIGADPNLPEIVVFVTHASAERAGEKKFWRTVQEVIEAKHLESEPKVVSVLFAGSVKPGIKEAYKTLFDGVYHLEDTVEGDEISSYLIDLVNESPAAREDTCKNLLASNVSKGNFPHWEAFENNIEKLIQNSHGSFHSIMVSPNFQAKGRIPQYKPTSLRRSLAILLSFPEDVRNNLEKCDVLTEAPKHAILLGWLCQTINGYRIADEMLKQFLNTTRAETIQYLIEYTESNLKQYNQYIKSIQNIEVLDICGEWILEHFRGLCTTEGMSSAMNSIYSDVHKPLANKIPSNKAPEFHWLFQLVMTVLRTETQRRDGYGYSALAKDIGYATSGHGQIQLQIVPFLQLKKPLPPELHSAVADVFSQHLMRIGYKGINHLLTQSLFGFATHIFNYQMIGYRFLNPIEWLLCKALGENGFDFQWPVDHISFISSDVVGRTTSTGNMISILDGRIWVKCQSAYNGRIDKRKELCGRVGAMKLVYTETELKQKRFYLVIDGDFNELDLSLLAKAGWDGIYYYHEISKLIEDVKLWL
jgi:hypothetical protein